MDTKRGVSHIEGKTRTELLENTALRKNISA